MRCADERIVYYFTPKGRHFKLYSVRRASELNIFFLFSSKTLSIKYQRLIYIKKKKKLITRLCLNTFENLNKLKKNK